MDNKLTPAQKRKLTKEKVKAKKDKSKQEYHAKRAIKLQSSINVSDDKKKSIAEALTCIGYKNITVRQLPLTNMGKKNAVVQIKVKHDGMNKATIQKQIEAVRRVFLKNGENVKFQLSLLYPEGIRSGKFTSMFSPVHFISIIEYNGEITLHAIEKEHLTDANKFDEYYLYIEYFPANIDLHGYTPDNYNDCLYKCLEQVLFEDLYKYWATPADLKKWLKIDRYAMTNKEHLRLVEKKIGYKIIMSGDDIYNSDFNSNKIIRVKLQNNHLTLNYKRNYLIKSKIAFEEKQILLYNKKTYEGYDGNKLWILTKEERNNIFSDKQNTLYTMIIKSKNNLSMQEEYKLMIDIANRMKKVSKGEVNLYKSGGYTSTSLNISDKYNKHIETDAIDTIEAKWILESSTGAIMACNPYEGEAHDIDIVSAYPALMASSILFPIKEPEYKHITTPELEGFTNLGYGLYRCIIHKSDDENINRMCFRFNPENKYTHLCLRRARELNLKIEMIEDGDANVVLYSRNKLITGRELFGKCINKLFEYKKQDEIFKEIISKVWGPWTELKQTKHYVNYTDEFNYGTDEEIFKITPNETDDTNIIKTIRKNQYFKFNLARIKPFILSAGRCNLSRIVYPFRDAIVKIHTDGAVVKYKPDIVYGVGLGDVKYHGKNNNYWIKNMNQFSKEKFKII